MFIRIFAALGLVLLAVLVGCGGGNNSEPSPTWTAWPTTSSASPSAFVLPDGQRKTLRWLNVAVTVPEGMGVELDTRAGLQSFSIVYQSSSVVVDGGTGQVLYRDHIEPRHESAMEAILDTMEVRPPDPATAPWPISSQQPAGLQLRTWGFVSYYVPPQDSGMSVTESIEDCFCDTPGTGMAIYVRNGRSEARVYFDSTTSTLQVDRRGGIAPEDVEVFERYLAEVKVVSKSRDGSD